MRRQFLLLSFFLVPCLLASLAFSYALATSPAQGSAAARAARPARGRSVVQELRYTNPFLPAGTDFAFPKGGDESDDPDGFDLGDACLGTIARRYITAAGGHLPYVFALKPLLGTQASEFDRAPALPAMSPAGVINGTIPLTAGRFLRFNVLLTDIIGTERLGTFRFNNVLCLPGLFRFAQDRLPTAQQNGNYFTSLETLAGFETLSAPVAYSVVAGSVASTGVSGSSRLEDVGLALSSDGILFGRPTKNADISFTARATSGGAAALNRAGQSENQPFKIPVEKAIPVTSELAAAQCTVRGSRTVAGGDSFSYSGTLDTRGLAAASLAAKPFELRIGTARIIGTFDARGRINQDLGSSGKTKRRLSVTLTPRTGRIRVKLSGADIARGILPLDANGNILNAAGATVTKSHQTLVLAMDFGAFRACEVLAMQTSALSQAKYKMDYLLGKKGFSRAGAFQIVSIKGADDKKFTGDRWLVRFLGMPGQDAEAPGTGADFVPPLAPAALATAVAGKVTIRIGSNFSQDVTVTKQSVRFEFKAASTADGIFRVVLDPAKFLHRVETNVLLADDTGIPAAINTKDVTVFPLGLDITGFSGETGRIIAPDRGAWKQK